jgi:hypothetical protein
METSLRDANRPAGAAVASLPGGSRLKGQFARRLLRLRFLRGKANSTLCRVGSHITRFEACSAFTAHYGPPARRDAPRRVDLEGFDGFIASTAAPIAIVWSD